MTRIHDPARGPVGDLFAYANAVRVGSRIWVSGAAPYDAQGRLVADDEYAQTVQVLANLEQALRSVGAELTHVVATRIYVLDASRWREVGRAFGETFRDIRPTATLVAVQGLLGPGMRVEIEAEAIVE